MSSTAITVVALLAVFALFVGASMSGPSPLRSHADRLDALLPDDFSPEQQIWIRACAAKQLVGADGQTYHRSVRLCRSEAIGLFTTPAKTMRALHGIDIAED